MTPREIRLVQSSWTKLLPIQDAAAQFFYGKLFELDPTLEPLFKGDMAEQRRKLMRMITTAVNGIGRLDEIVPAVQDLGRRHVGYGVKDAHYDTVGAALLWTLEQGLGKDFTPELKQAWSATYGLLAATMKEAAATALA
ncbi:MAG: globin family protein [Burkholderiales bacterium]